ncbi:Hypothetical protein, putative [Bodo saltans]|uniref:Uncharacterized protein n=1 Tax=Bodo saltans TaxID=75058 RepID=A0A0S4JN86_BODSA|nr:Hypothetical protein, putative [Bodo saltans]|eukprot:CUG90581.1 Hypothetical protein, putative [Bodo saltans]
MPGTAIPSPGPPPVVDPYDLGLLREEAARIKQSLYSEYGDVINRMYHETNVASSSSSGEPGGSGDQKKTQAELWQDKIDELIAVQKPLKSQIKKCQQEAIQKLVDAAQDEQRRGLDVNSKLTMLLSLQAGQKQ